MGRVESGGRVVETELVIVGAGVAGLTSALELSRMGVRTLVLERNEQQSNHPKATGVSTRTMEIVRSWGLEEQIRARSLELDPFASAGLNLVAEELERTPLGYPTRAEAAQWSPTWAAVCAQDAFEPVLLRALQEFPSAQVRFGMELLDLRQTAAGVEAQLLNVVNGERFTARARYMIAADGASSRVRRLLGIAIPGEAQVGEYASVLFRADLESYTRGRNCALYFIRDPQLPGVLVPTSRDGRWMFATPWMQPGSPLDLDTAQHIEWVRGAIGVPDLAVQVLDVRRVGLGVQIAERFRAGNVFLAGDAAHRMMPSGGMGLNTALHSAHNLAWKLGAVLQGWAGEQLLDSHEVERRPVAQRNVARSRGQRDALSGVGADLGVVYASDAIVADAGDGNVALEPDAPVRSGSRAPHVWLERRGARVSSLDLFGRGFVLLHGLEGRNWARQATAAAQLLRVPLQSHTIGSTELLDSTDRWRSSYGIERDGAVLVRPDGHIAWRAVSAQNAEISAADALAIVLDRSDRAAEENLLAQAS